MIRRQSIQTGFSYSLFKFDCLCSRQVRYMMIMSEVQNQYLLQILANVYFTLRITFTLAPDRGYRYNL